MAKAVKAPRKKPNNNYKMPAPLPAGEVLEDLNKKQWILGKSIGKGGFGEIYSAKEAASSDADHPFVIKIEPHDNGPLFVEMHFYMRNCRANDIETFMKKHKLHNLGIPTFLGNGSYEYNTQKYRFIVMEKFGKNIDELFKANKGFSVGTVFKLALQMLHALEYIHQCGYVHADLKGPNILMGCGHRKYQAFLVDFGLALKFVTGTKYQPNPKKAHDGTMEFLSRDAHKGVPTRRGDLEVLAYNLIFWLGGKLPWMNKLKDADTVHKMKTEFIDNIPNSINSIFKHPPPEELIDYITYVSKMTFNEEPDYKQIREIFKSAIKKSGDKDDSKLSFNINGSSPNKRKNSVEYNKGSPEKKKKPIETKVKSKDKDSTNNDETQNNAEVILTAEMKRLLKKKEENAALAKKKKTTKKNGTISNSDTKSNNMQNGNDKTDEKYDKKKQISKKNVLKEIPKTTSDEYPRNRRNLARKSYEDK